jgi:hypothetical protein
MSRMPGGKIKGRDGEEFWPIWESELQEFKYNLKLIRYQF